MLVANVDSADSNVGTLVCICVTTGCITPTALFSYELSSVLLKAF